MAHLAHSWLTHGSLDSHGSLLAQSADLADLTDLAHSYLVLSSLGSFLAHLAHLVSLGSLLALPWLILGSPLAYLSHSCLLYSTVQRYNGLPLDMRESSLRTFKRTLRDVLLDE